MSGNPGKEMIPFPLICDLLPSPKVTLPPFLDSKTLKKDQSPVMCLEQPLSRYHKHVSITLNANFIIKHTSCLDDKLVGMVLSLNCLIWAKPLTFTLLRRTPLHILILRQSSFFLVKLRSFPMVIRKITFKLVFSETLRQIEIRKTRCIWKQRSLQADYSHDNRGQWINTAKIKP